MSMLGGAGTLGTIVTIFATLLQAVDGRFIRRLRKSGATGPRTALGVERMGRLTSWRVKRMVDRGVVRRAGAAGYFFDEERFRQHRRRRVRILVVVALAAAGILIVAWLLR